MNHAPDAGLIVQPVALQSWMLSTVLQLPLYLANYNCQFAYLALFMRKITKNTRGWGVCVGDNIQFSNDNSIALLIHVVLISIFSFKTLILPVFNFSLHLFVLER